MCAAQSLKGIGQKLNWNDTATSKCLEVSQRDLLRSYLKLTPQIAPGRRFLLPKPAMASIIHFLGSIVTRVAGVIEA